MLRRKLLTTCAWGVPALVALGTTPLLPALARVVEQIRWVGSSTVFPFGRIAANFFPQQIYVVNGEPTSFDAPVIESTGTGGGMVIFAQRQSPIAAASRPMKLREYENCEAAGMTGIVHIPLGYDGIVAGTSVRGFSLNITRAQFFLALAAQVPEFDTDGNETGNLIANPYGKWSEINPNLPDVNINVMLPPNSSGTRDAYNEMVMEKGGKEFETVSNHPDADEILITMRTDGHVRFGGETDTEYLDALDEDPTLVVIIGYSYLDQNRARVQGSLIEGVPPTYENISSGEYPVSRMLQVYWWPGYTEGDDAPDVPGLVEFLEFLVAEENIGDFGRFEEAGLILLSPEEREASRRAVGERTPMERPAA